MPYNRALEFNRIDPELQQHIRGKNHKILQEQSVPRPLARPRTQHKIIHQDKRRTNQRSEGNHEPHEEVQSRHKSAAPLSVRVVGAVSHPVRHHIDDDEGHGAEYPREVVALLLANQLRVYDGDVYHKPPACEEEDSGPEGAQEAEFFAREALEERTI